MRKVLISTALCAVMVSAYPTGSLAATSPEFQKGRQAYDKQDYPTALKHFRLAEQRAGKDASVHYYLANTLVYTGSFEEAKKHYQKCLDLDPSSEAGAMARVALFSFNGAPGASYASVPSVPQPYFQQAYGAQQSYPQTSSLPPGGFASANMAAPSYTPAAAVAPDGQSVRQFVQDLNDQLADRKRLASREAASASYDRMYEMQAWQPYNPQGRHNRGWGDPYQMYGGYRNYPSPYNNGIATSFNAPYGATSYYGGRPARHGGMRSRRGDPTFGGIGSRYDPFSQAAEQKSLAFEQVAAGLESQMLNGTGGVRINPKGSNLYVRNYDPGNAPAYQPAPIVELLAKQEKLVIDEPSPKSRKLSSGAKHAAQEAH